MIAGEWGIIMFRALRSLFGRTDEVTQTTKPQRALDANAGHAQRRAYSSDRPIRSRREDRFGRWPFAKRIADTLANRIDPESLVIGLYGPWGDGKSSTLHLMEESLSENGAVVVVAFNPWLFRSEDTLIRSFFDTLAGALNKKLPTKGEEIGKVLSRYGSILSTASISIPGVASINLGTGAKALGDVLSNTELSDLKNRLETILADSGQRVVVLIDDIDRLDRNETHAILKLVKLSADFRHTAYVLAFDDEMVAAAVGERYGTGSLEAGHSFLEKIIQVPLRQPPADQVALRRLVFESVDAALVQSDISLDQEKVDAFVRHYVDGIEPHVKTPRQVKLLGNAITFALPILKGEAHPVDLMLMEGIRIFFPKLYTAIRDNPRLFLAAPYGEHQQLEAHRQRVAALIKEVLPHLQDSDCQRIRSRLLEPLFPRLRQAQYDNEWESEWRSEQRICSEQYFSRFFGYGVPPGDVADSEITDLLSGIGAKAPEAIDAVLEMLASRGAMANVIRKFRERAHQLASGDAASLALALARCGKLIPRERGMYISDVSLMQGAILQRDLLRRVEQGPQRDQLAVDIANISPLPIGFECLRWMRQSEDDADQPRLISEAGEERIFAVLVDRITADWRNAPVYQTYGQDTPALLWAWNECNHNAINAELRARFDAHPTEVDQLLDTYVGLAWGMESGLPRRADFDRHSYSAIARLIDPGYIAGNLRKRYGPTLDNPQFHLPNRTPLAERIAHQFAYIHQEVQRRAVQAARQPARPEQQQAEEGNNAAPGDQRDSVDD